MSTPLYDWDTIRNEYVMGLLEVEPKTGRRKHRFPTHQELHDRYGMNLQYLKEKSSQESWGMRRKAFMSKAKNQIVDWKLGAFINESAQVDAMTVDKIKKVHRVMDIYLEQALTSDEVLITPSELQAITGTLEKCHKLMRITNNEPTDVTSIYKELKKALLAPKNAERYRPILDVESRAVEDPEKRLALLARKERLLEKELQEKESLLEKELEEKEQEKKKPLNKTSEEKSIDKTSEEKSIDKTSEEKSIDKTSQERPLHRTSQERPLHRTSEEKPLHRTSQERPLHKTSQGKPERFKSKMLDREEDPLDMLDTEEDTLDMLDMDEDPLDMLDTRQDPLDMLDTRQDPLDMLDTRQDPLDMYEDTLDMLDDREWVELGQDISPYEISPYEQEPRLSPLEQEPRLSPYEKELLPDEDLQDLSVLEAEFDLLEAEFNDD